MSQIQAPAELIVLAKPSSGLHAAPSGISGAPAAKADSLSKLLKAAKLTMEPLFGTSEERVRASMSAPMMRSAPDTIDPATFYTLQGEVKNPKKLIADLLNEPAIEAAYYKPGGEPPIFMDDGGAEAASAPTGEGPPAATPDFTSRQGYLEVAPGGIDARFAWTKSGGRGDGVRVIDLEWGWNFSHEDLLVNSGGLLDGSNHADKHHGTAVLGEIGGDHNTRGIHGISPNARLSAISFVGNSSAGAIRKAADRLSAGDIILLEIHRAGPRHNFQARSDQLGYIAIEWWPDDFAAILYATSRGILVVEAAGNGAENLDDAIYSVRPSGFPSSWRNPFNRGNPQCGAILVGAGAPPPGTHGRNHGADRSRLGFSNYGSAVDVQGWGREVTTTGYGGLFNDSVNQQYTDTFSGTSSASPIVVGALACVQGWLRAAGKPVRTPAQARTLLRTTGSPQQNEPGRPATQRIGNRPNLRTLHSKLFPKVIKEFKEIKEVKEIEKVKEVKDFDKIVKEVEKLKDIKEVGEKNIKEKDKEKDIFEGGLRGGGVIRPNEEAAAAESIDARLAALEATVGSLVQALQVQAASGAHFIGQELRPDVGGYNPDAEDSSDDGSA
jgi:hypothetical protein